MDDADTAIPTNSGQNKSKDVSEQEINRQNSELERQLSIRSTILEEHQDVPYGEEGTPATFIGQWLTQSSLAKVINNLGN